MAISPLLRSYLALVAFSIAGSVFARVTGMEPGWIAPISSAATVALGVTIVCRSAFRSGGHLTWVGLVAVVFVGASSELLGLYTGFPFGNYAYTGRWWPSIPLPSEQTFPLLLPFAWMMMAGGSYLAISRHVPGPQSVILGALLAAVLDLGMEPVMVHELGYWMWPDGGPLPGGVPIANFFGWFGTSLIAGALLRATGAVQVKDDEPAWVLVGHAALVAALGLLGLL